jgi:hypothetical protein
MIKLFWYRSDESMKLTKVNIKVIEQEYYLEDNVTRILVHSTVNHEKTHIMSAKRRLVTDKY